MAFNPDAYLSDLGSFNPDAYLASQPQGQPSNAGLQDVANSIQGMTDAVMQPLGRASDTVARGASNLMFGSEKPAQYAEQGVGLVGQGIQKLGEGVAGGTGYIAQKLAPAGSNMTPTDYAAATAGMAISAIPQIILSKYLAGEPTEQPEGLPLNVAQSREARTGVPAKEFQRLYQDPGALFAKGNTEEAGQQIGIAKANADINLGVQHNDISTLTPENIQMARSPRAIGKDALSNISENLQAAKELLPNGQPEEQIALANIHPDTVNKALTDSNNRLSKLVPGTPAYQSESAIKSNLQNILQNVAPEVKAQNAAFARLKLRDIFQGSEALNKNKTPSKLALIAQQVPKAAGAAIGGSLFGPGGAAAGYEGGKILAEMYHSPFVTGLQTAAGGALNSSINPLLSGIERNASGPLIQAYLARYHANQ